MRNERVIYVQDRHRTPLALRARFAWTFFGTGLFAAINLFLMGIYFLLEAVRDPLDSSPASIVAGSFMLTLAFFLLAYLTLPRVKAFFVHQARIEPRRPFNVQVLTIYPDSPKTEDFETEMQEIRRDDSDAD